MRAAESNPQSSAEARNIHIDPINELVRLGEKYPNAPVPIACQLELLCRQDEILKGSLHNILLQRSSLEEISRRASKGHEYFRVRSISPEVAEVVIVNIFQIMEDLRFTTPTEIHAIVDPVDTRVPDWNKECVTRYYQTIALSHSRAVANATGLSFVAKFIQRVFGRK